VSSRASACGRFGFVQHCNTAGNNLQSSQSALCRRDFLNSKEAIMDEDALNTSVRKFLKTLGVTAQREIEKAVRDADAKGKLKNGERLPAKAVVTVGGIDLKFEINGDIELA
jgi:hypothetical protein